MAAAARAVRRDDKQHTPPLKVLHGGKVRRTPCARKPSRSEAACKQTFTIACTVLIIATCVGMGRVAVTVKATEAAVAASSLAADIETERVALEQLEADRSTLVAPPRIQSLAETSMKMGSAGQVTYIELPTVDASAVAADLDGVHTASAGVRSDKVAQVLTGIMRMTAGEAQVLLVGDAGLASSR